MPITKCRAIVINTIAYGENSVVLKSYTDAFGLQTYIINGVRSRKGNIKPSQLQPLSLLEIEAYHHGNKNMQRIKELKCFPILHQLHFDMLKSAVGIFTAEVIGKCIREENHPDERLFAFLFNTIQILDMQQESIVNYPVYFLSQLARYLGVLPKGLFTDSASGFDIREGLFGPHDPGNPFQLPETSSRHLSELLQSSFETYPMVNINHAERKVLLEWLITFYQEHVSNFNTLKSHKILSEVLG